MASRRNPRPTGFLISARKTRPLRCLPKCPCGDSRLRLSSQAKRGAAPPNRRSASDQIRDVRGWSRPSGPRQHRRFENRPRPLYKLPYGPSARHPSNSRPHSPTPRPNHNRRRTSSSRSSPGSHLHQPPSIPKSGSHGSSSRYRTSRPATATPPPSRPSSRSSFRPRPRRRPRGAILVSASPVARSTPPERRRRTLRHSRRLRRRPPPQPSPDADHRPRRRNLLRHQRRNSPEIPPPTPPLKQMSK